MSRIDSTRDYGFYHATGDILGRFDADCMIRPDWVEVVSGIFTEDPDAMGATGPVMYYDLPSCHFGLRGDNSTRKRIYKADDGQPSAVWFEYGPPRYSLA